MMKFDTKYKVASNKYEIMFYNSPTSKKSGEWNKHILV